MSNESLPRPHVRAGVITAALALVVASCGTSPGETKSGESLDDMSPTTLRVQSSHAPDAAPSRAYQAWQEAVEKGSNGKLKFEMFYKDALAPITEAEDALASGLIDIATHAPMYNAARFPTENLIQSMNSMITPSPVAGTLQGMGAQTEFAFDDVYSSPMPEQGVQPLIQPMAVIPVYHLGCSGDPVRSPEEAAGKRVRVPGEHLGSEVKALGMVPTATTISELYESLERGVVDCVLAPPADIRDLGLLDVIDHWVIDPEVMWTGVSGVQVSMSKDAWDGLPEAARQLLWDTAAEAFLPTIIKGVLDDSADAISQATEKGIKFHTWNEDARTALRDFHADTIASAAAELDNGKEFVARFNELHEQWLKELPELGFDTATAKDTFEEFDTGDIDFKPYVERIKKARAAGRP